MVWTMVLIVTLKYVLVLLNADNKGEGGTFALMALGQSVAKRSSSLILVLGVVGAAFFYGDAVITPAISVLSAVEGLKLVAPHMEAVVLPLTIAILVVLFAVQSRGTAKVAQLFGPIMLVWFVALAIGGLIHIVDDLRVFLALNPLLGVQFILTHGIDRARRHGPDLPGRHRCRSPLRRPRPFRAQADPGRLVSLVQPALILNYFGQGALLLANPEAIDNPFYRLYPSWALIPMVLLATVATVIASQAVITGAFSFTRQAIQLGLLPRLAIRHTSESVAGQIYLPRVNQLLFVGVVLVTLIFRSSSDLAAAYGLSVTATMVIDSLMAFFVVWRCWGWPVWKVAAADRAAADDRAGLPRRQHAQDPGRRLAAAAGRRRHHPRRADLGARLGEPGAGHAQERGRARLAGAQAGSQAAASRARHGRVPDRRPELGADLPDAQSQAQPRAARAQHHPDHQDRGHAARAAPRAHRDRARRRHASSA